MLIMQNFLQGSGQSKAKVLIQGFISLALSMYVLNAGAMSIDTKDGEILSLQGVIEPGDTEKLQRLLRGYPQPQRPRDHRTVELTVVINSAGGDVAEALKMGRYLRSRNSAIIADIRCASSCVFVLASGIVRSGNGKLVIHRPFSTEIARQPQTGMLRKLEDELTVYVAEMNVPKRLVEQVFSIAPENAHELSKQEVDQFRLKQMDIEYAEELSIYNARVSGLTRTEYMRRLRIYRNQLDQCDFVNKRAMELARCFRSSLENLGLKGEYDWL